MSIEDEGIEWDGRPVLRRKKDDEGSDRDGRAVWNGDERRQTERRRDPSIGPAERGEDETEREYRIRRIYDAIAALFDSHYELFKVAEDIETCIAIFQDIRSLCDEMIGVLAPSKMLMKVDVTSNNPRELTGSVRPLEGYQFEALSMKEEATLIGLHELQYLLRRMYDEMRLIPPLEAEK